MNIGHITMSSGARKCVKCNDDLEINSKRYSDLRDLQYDTEISIESVTSQLENVCSRIQEYGNLLYTGKDFQFVERLLIKNLKVVRYRPNNVFQQNTDYAKDGSCDITRCKECQLLNSRINDLQTKTHEDCKYLKMIETAYSQIHEDYHFVFKLSTTSLTLSDAATATSMLSIAFNRNCVKWFELNDVPTNTVGFTGMDMKKSNPTERYEMHNRDYRLTNTPDPTPTKKGKGTMCQSVNVTKRNKRPATWLTAIRHWVVTRKKWYPKKGKGTMCQSVDATERNKRPATWLTEPPMILQDPQYKPPWEITSKSPGKETLKILIIKGIPMIPTSSLKWPHRKIPPHKRSPCDMPPHAQLDLEEPEQHSQPQHVEPVSILDDHSVFDFTPTSELVSEVCKKIHGYFST